MCSRKMVSVHNSSCLCEKEIDDRNEIGDAERLVTKRLNSPQRNDTRKGEREILEKERARKARDRRENV